MQKDGIEHKLNSYNLQKTKNHEITFRDGEGGSKRNSRERGGGEGRRREGWDDVFYIAVYSDRLYQVLLAL